VPPTPDPPEEACSDGPHPLFFGFGALDFVIAQKCVGLEKLETRSIRGFL